jgi:polyisoprenoid-binding protein YceI
MLKRISLSLLVLLAVGSLAAADTWTFDKAHSKVGFAVRHMVISTITGSFGDYDGTVSVDGDKAETAVIDVTVKVASINTDNQQRDEHLRSADFFNVGQFPTMHFKSKKVTMRPDSTFAMVGDLTIKDVTKEVTLTGKFQGKIDDPWGNTRAGFTASTTINRQDFHVSWSNVLKDGSLVVSNNVDINLEVELVKSK